MSTTRNLFLVGLMGAGKTTVGKLLAEEMGWDFLDCDAVLEQRTGRCVSALFDAEGEESFRRREKHLLAELAAGERKILATGGGAVLDPENRELMRQQGRTAYLHAPVPVLARRVGSGDGRPLLRGAAPEEVLARLAAERDNLYRETAQRVIDTGDATPPEAAAVLAAWLRE